MNTRLSIEAKTFTITQLLSEFNFGKYHLPSFQRNFVWDEEDIKELIDSIMKNYPVGNIILWKMKSKNKIDPFSKPFVDLKKKSDEIYYVIDGQQRLTSLYLLFNNWEIKRDGEVIKREPVRYNPTNKSLYKGANTERGIDLSKIIKAYHELDADILKSLTKEISKVHNTELRDIIQKVLLQYPIPFYIIETHHADSDTFSEMAMAFIRVNKNGIRIGNLELMLSFLAGSVSGKLKDSISKLFDKLNKDFEIDLQPVIRIAFTNFNLKQTQISKVQQFKNNIKKISSFGEQNLIKKFEISEKSLIKTIGLLKKYIGLSSARVIPSQTSLVILAKYFQKNNLSSNHKISHLELKKIINWFILVNFNGYYSSHTDTKLDNDIDLINKSKDFPFSKLVKNMNKSKFRTKITLNDLKRGLKINILRSQGRTYLFLLYILLVKNNADDWNSKLLSKCRFDSLAKHHIFPKEYLSDNLQIDESDELEISINNLGNITFINKGINSEIGDEDPTYLNKYKSSLQQHFIPQTLKKLSIDKYEEFLFKRIINLYGFAKIKYKPIFK